MLPAWWHSLVGRFGLVTGGLSRSDGCNFAVAGFFSRAAVLPKETSTILLDTSARTAGIQVECERQHFLDFMDGADELPFFVSALLLPVTSDTHSEVLL